MMSVRIMMACVCYLFFATLPTYIDECTHTEPCMRRTIAMVRRKVKKRSLRWSRRPALTPPTARPKLRGDALRIKPSTTSLASSAVRVFVG